MRKSPKYVNYVVIAQTVELFGGVFVLFYCIHLVRITCNFLGIQSLIVGLLFYFIWLAVIILPVYFVHNKLGAFFAILNEKWYREWREQQK